MNHTNPLRYVDGVDRTDPDPFVLRFRGQYWCYSSGFEGVNVSVSDDMLVWRRLDSALRVPGRVEYWAPCVIHADGMFWMYFSNRPAGSDDPHEEVLQVATSPVPEGPFEVRARFFDTFSIDPHVVRDPANGEYVMFYSTNDVTGLDLDGTGTSIVADRLVAMDRLAGEPRPVVVPTLEQEIFERDRFGDGRDWYTIEGATYVTRRGTAYLTYSGNAYVGEDYFIGYATAPLDGSPADLSWSKYPSDHVWAPLVRRSDAVEGTGHNSIVRAPNLVDDWIVYHGRDAATPITLGREERVMRIDPLFYDGDRLATTAPTATAQEAPARPTVGDDFSGDALGTHWTTAAGVFVPGDADGPGMVRTGRDLTSTLVHAHESDAYVAEVFVRADTTDAGARFGVHPIHHGDGDHTELLLDTATSTALLRGVRGRIATTLATAPLTGFDPTHWHALRIERTLDEISVFLDDAELLTASTGDARPGAFALASVGTPTRFSAFTLTEHLDLYGPRLAHLAHLFAADRDVAVDERGIGSRNRRPVVLTGALFPVAGPDGSRAPGVATYDVDLLSPGGSAGIAFTVDPDTDERTDIRVDLAADTYEITATTAGRERSIVTGTHERRTSVRVAVHPDTLTVQVGTRRHELDVACRHGLAQRVELVGALLRGVELTSLRGANNEVTLTEKD